MLTKVLKNMRKEKPQSIFQYVAILFWISNFNFFSFEFV